MPHRGFLPLVAATLLGLSPARADDLTPTQMCQGLCDAEYAAVFLGLEIVGLPVCKPEDAACRALYLGGITLAHSLCYVKCPPPIAPATSEQ